VTFSRLRPWLVLAVIFLVGIATGSALTVAWHSHFSQPPGAQQMKKHLLDRLTERLKLTPDQQAKIEPILTDADNQMQSIHHDEIQRMTQIYEKTNSEIAAILTPDQQAEMQKMVKEFQASHDRDHMFPGHGKPKPPHDGPDGPDDHDKPPGPPPPPGPA